MKMLNELRGYVFALMSNHNSATQASEARFKSGPVGKRVWVRRCLGDEGSNIVEFALILPALMMLLTGILSFGSAMMNYESLTNATAVGAQKLVTSRTSTTDPCADTFAAITGAAPTLIPANINLTVTMNGTAVNSNTCSGNQSLLQQGQAVTVHATYPCNIGVYGVTVTPGCVLQATISEYEF